MTALAHPKLLFEKCRATPWIQRPVVGVHQQHISYKKKWAGSDCCSLHFCFILDLMFRKKWWTRCNSGMYCDSATIVTCIMGLLFPLRVRTKLGGWSFTWPTKQFPFSDILSCLALMYCLLQVTSYYCALRRFKELLKLRPPNWFTAALQSA